VAPRATLVLVAAAEAVGFISADAVEDGAALDTVVVLLGGELGEFVERAPMHGQTVHMCIVSNIVIAGDGERKMEKEQQTLGTI